MKLVLKHEVVAGGHIYLPYSELGIILFEELTKAKRSTISGLTTLNQTT